jgi:hypothetical protein
MRLLAGPNLIGGESEKYFEEDEGDYEEYYSIMKTEELEGGYPLSSFTLYPTYEEL